MFCLVVCLHNCWSEGSSTILLLQARAKAVLRVREENEAQKKAKDDIGVIEQKRKEHQTDYAERRKALLDRGVRSTHIYKRYEKRDIANEAGKIPELAIVIRGEKETLCC